jgi:hypothetical protein
MNARTVQLPHVELWSRCVKPFEMLQRSSISTLGSHQKPPPGMTTIQLLLLLVIEVCKQASSQAKVVISRRFEISFNPLQHWLEVIPHRARVALLYPGINLLDQCPRGFNGIMTGIKANSNIFQNVQSESKKFGDNALSRNFRSRWARDQVALAALGRLISSTIFHITSNDST